MKRRAPWELQVLINEAINRRIDREITSMVFKGGKPNKGKEEGKGKDVANILEMYRELANTQQAAIHALAAALGATEEADEDEDEDTDEEEDKDEDKE